MALNMSFNPVHATTLLRGYIMHIFWDQFKNIWWSHSDVSKFPGIWWIVWAYIHILCVNLLCISVLCLSTYEDLIRVFA